jgi:hypothetical protein
MPGVLAGDGEAGVEQALEPIAVVQRLRDSGVGEQEPDGLGADRRAAKVACLPAAHVSRRCAVS